MVYRAAASNRSSRPVVLGAGLSALLHGLAIAAIVPVTLSFWPADQSSREETPVRAASSPAASAVSENELAEPHHPTPAMHPPGAIGDTGFVAEVVFVAPDTLPPVPAAPAEASAPAARAAQSAPPARTAIVADLDHPTQLSSRVAPPFAAAVHAARQHEPRLAREDAARWKDRTVAGSQAVQQSVERFRMAAAAGRHFARYNLALAHLHGRGVERDPLRAFKEMEQSARAGYPPAMLRLAEQHLAGLGPARDAIEGAAWYRVAAAVGSHAGGVASSLIDAQFTLEQRAATRQRAIALQASLSPQRPLDWQQKNLALLRAIDSGNRDEVDRLLSDGADGNAADGDGRNGLISAAWRGHTDVADLLIKAGTDPDSVDNQGRNALMWASINGHTPLVRILIGKLATVDARDASGLTALMRAAWNGHGPVVRELLGAGANAALRDNEGMTALQRARLGKADAVVQLLRNSNGSG